MDLTRDKRIDEMVQHNKPEITVPAYFSFYIFSGNCADMMRYLFKCRNKNELKKQRVMG